MKFDKEDCYLFEPDLSEFQFSTFPVPVKLQTFLHTSIGSHEKPNCNIRKRIGSQAECVTISKYLCSRLTEEINNEIELIEDGVNPELITTEFELNKKRKSKTQNERKAYVSNNNKLRPK